VVGREKLEKEINEGRKEEGAPSKKLKNDEIKGIKVKKGARSCMF